MKHRKIVELISKKNNIDRFDRELIERLFEPINCKKNELLEKENEISTYLYFINSGFVRLYYFQDGLEITSHINCPSGFITSFDSFVSNTKSNENVECITACELLRISKKNLEILYQNSSKWVDFGRIIYDQAIVYNEQRTKDIITLSAKQRYLKLLVQHPDIIQNIPLQYIASFIGIKPESLSRIRKQVIS
jgi:CRP-like cAMP-binding protein